MLFEIAVLFVLAVAFVAGWFVTQDVADERVAMRRRMPRWLYACALHCYAPASGVFVAVILTMGVWSWALVLVLALNFLVGALHEKQPVRAVCWQAGVALVVGAAFVVLSLLSFAP